MAGKWEASRGDGGAVTMTVAPSLAAEAEAIRDKIELLRKAGVPYAQQAILARTHLTLSRITGILEQLGVPLLYLGDLFERDEIRNLLSLLAIDAEYGGIGLVRVTALPQYAVPRADALAVIRWSRTNKTAVCDTLQQLDKVEGISDGGRLGLEKLRTELAGLRHASPWTMLTTWLFERSDYLHAMLTSADVAAQQKLVAIYHLVKVSAEQIALGDYSRKGFLNRIRRIEALNQDNAYRVVASEAGDMDAVRVMTIHGSKGLEFRAVHLPALATRYMPTSRQGNRCPPPTSLAKLAIGPAEHDAEEQCLFLVALSRARDFLSLSRAERYTQQKATASKFLPCIERLVPVTRYDGSGATYAETFHPHPSRISGRYEERHLSVYMKCPARYRYEVLEELHGSRFESPYVQFHRCVYSTIRWLEEQRKTGLPTDPAIALSQLQSFWDEHGPVGHGFEAFYRNAADEMVRAMAVAITGEVAAYYRGEWLVPVAERHVVVTPDRVILAADGVVHVQRIRTGRETKSESDKPIYALLRQGAEAQYPGKPVVVETYYLSASKCVLIPPDGDESSLAQYAEAIEGIEAGHFEPRPEPRTCPTCQCYFVCRC